MLGLTGWQRRPPRLRVAGRLVRIGWFTTQPAGLLTASCDDRHNVELLIIPPDTDAALAEAAMNLAVQAGNCVAATDILLTVAARQSAQETHAQNNAAMGT
jgi:uncharacterized protein DUF5994